MRVPWYTMPNPFKPEYVFRPSQLLLRLRRSRGAAPQTLVLPLPWGLPLQVSTADEIGLAVWQLGVYDLPVSEVAWRLLDPGECAWDVGANIGYVTSLLAARLGRAGRVLAFEPHPRIHAVLAGQTARWSGDVAAVELHREALSDQAGTAWLQEPAEFEHNQGTSTLEGGVEGQGNGFEVRTLTMDSLCPPERPPALMKVDVEGHELAVFQGGRALLGSGAVRDIIFEEHHGYPSPSCTLLEELGFTIQRIRKGFWSPQLIPPGQGTGEVWLPPSFLATRDLARARERLSASGWRVLRGR